MIWWHSTLSLCKPAAHKSASQGPGCSTPVQPPTNAPWQIAKPNIFFFLMYTFVWIGREFWKCRIVQEACWHKKEGTEEKVMEITLLWEKGSQNQSLVKKKRKPISLNKPERILAIQNPSHNLTYKLTKKSSNAKNREKKKNPETWFSSLK